MLDLSGHHIGRSWTAHHVEDACPCPQADCGLVLFDTIDPACPEHHWSAAKSIRQSHPATKCKPTPEARRMMVPSTARRSGDATVAADMCPRCKGENAEAWALCEDCAANDSAAGGASHA